MVKLEGEAYFEVQSNPNNPFIVLTRDHLQVKAVGTKFNIKAYSNDDQITGTLIEGRIEVSNSLLSEVLAPNERISFNTKDGMFSKSRIDSVNEAIFLDDRSIRVRQRNIRRHCQNTGKNVQRNYLFYITRNNRDTI